jgi:hypothetical protein
MQISGGTELGYASTAILTELLKHLIEINVITPQATAEILEKSTGSTRKPRQPHGGPRGNQSHCRRGLRSWQTGNRLGARFNPHSGGPRHDSMVVAFVQTLRELPPLTAEASDRPRCG